MAVGLFAAMSTSLVNIAICRTSGLIYTLSAYHHG